MPEREEHGVAAGPRGAGLGIKALAAFAIIVVVDVLLGRWLEPFTGGEGGPSVLGGTLVGALKMAVQLPLAWLAARIVLGKHLHEEIHKHYTSWWVDLLVGAALGAVAILTVVLVNWAAGWLTVETWGWQALPTGEWLRALYLSFIGVLFAAVAEEAVYRAYLLGALEQAWGKWAGVIIVSLAFSVPRWLLRGAGETPWPVFVVMFALPSLLLAWAFLRTESPWFPLGIGLAWDWLQRDFFNLPGEEKAELAGALTRVHGPAWFVGTTEGIELGLAGVLGVGILALGVWLWTRGGHRAVEHELPPPHHPGLHRGKGE